MRGDEVKSFHDLIKEVQIPGICGRCGGCVSFCSAGELNALRFGKDGMPEFANEENCLKCGICYLICPQVKVLDNELRKKFHWKTPAGFYRALRSAKTSNRKIAAVATDGGVVSSLILHGLESRVIDGAVVSRQSGLFSRMPAIVTTAKEVIDAAGSYFGEVMHLGEFGRSYTTFVPVIREVSKLKERGLKRIALVGTPCQVYSLRKMQLLRVVPSDAITLVIGLFCMESFCFDKNARSKMEKRLGVKLDHVVKFNIKDDVIITKADGEVLHVPFELMEEVARPACFACPDFANDFADIACGGLGSPDRYTTVMVRTAKGEEIYNAAIQKGIIHEMKFKNKDEAVCHRSTIMAKIVSFCRKKRERAGRILEKR